MNLVETHIPSIFARLLAVVLMVATFVGVSAQTDVQLTQYYQVPSIYNPGAIGLSDNITLRGGGRMQWVGIDHAPRTFFLAANMPLTLFKKRFAVGVVAQQETAGLFRNLNVNLQAGYKIKLLKGELTAAVQFGYVSEVFKGSEIYIPDDDDFHQATDEALPQTDVSGTAIDISAGVHYTHKWFWAGVSCSHLTQPSIEFDDKNNTTTSGSTSGSTEGDATQKNYSIELRRTLYFMAGGNIPIKNTLFEVLPSVLVKSDFTFTRFELTSRLRYKKLFNVGIGYRHNDAVSLLLGAEFKGFVIGYAYDYPISAISKASHGSHELVLGYGLKINTGKKYNNKHKNIRLM